MWQQRRGVHLQYSNGRVVSSLIPVILLVSWRTTGIKTTFVLTNYFNIKNLHRSVTILFWVCFL